MNLLVNGGLSCPPNELVAFKQLCFYVYHMSEYDNLIVVSVDTRDFYYRWFKQNEISDYDDIVVDGEEKGVTLPMQEITLDILPQAVRMLGIWPR